MRGHRITFLSVFLTAALLLPSISALAKEGSWGAIVSGSRFQELTNFNNEAVLDRETGLIWEKNGAVSDNIPNNTFLYCYGKNVAGKMGWRLPKIEEVTSLFNGSTFAALGSINIDPNPSYVETGSPDTDTPGLRYYYSRATMSVQTIDPDNMSSNSRVVLCVRGGGN